MERQFFMLKRAVNFDRYVSLGLALVCFGWFGYCLYDKNVGETAGDIIWALAVGLACLVLMRSLGHQRVIITQLEEQSESTPAPSIDSGNAGSGE